MIGEIVSVIRLTKKRMLVQISGNSLTSNVRPDDSFIVNESFHDRNYVSVLSANINDETAFQSEKIGGQNWRFMHEKAIKFVGLIK